MKWVKVAIGAVIAIAVVPMIALSVFNLTQEQIKEETVTFEVLTDTTVTSGTYNLINAFESDENVFNYDLYINDIFISKAYYERDYDTSDSIGIFIDDNNFFLTVYIGDTITDLTVDGYDLNINDIIRLEGEITTPPVLSGVTATLLLLAPLIFAGGVLAYLLNKQNY